MLPKRGRPGLTLLMSVERELTAVDLVALSTGETYAPRQAPPVIQKLRSVHHSVAIALASGKTVQEAAYLVGYTPQRVSDLATKDPTFQHLVSTYRSQLIDNSMSESTRAQIKLLDISDLALEEIRERLENDVKREQMPLGELRQLAAMGLDRTVAPPKTAQPVTIVPTKITFNMGTRDLSPKLEGTVIDLDEE